MSRFARQFRRFFISSTAENLAMPILFVRRFPSLAVFLAVTLLGLPVQAVAIGTPSPIQGPDVDSDGTFTFSWGSVPGATRYRVKDRGDLDGDWYVNGTSYTTNSWYEGRYRLRVAACNNNGCGVYTGYHTVIVDYSLATPPPYKGFDHGYRIYSGDFNNDNRTDLLVGRDQVAGHLQPVRPFVLEQQADRSFVIKASSTNFSFSSFGLIEAPIYFERREINYDGKIDLFISGVADFIDGASDVMIIASDLPNQVPIASIELTAERQLFLEDAFGWATNQNYFEENAPLTVVGQNPAGANWFGAVADPRDFAAIAFLLGRCEAQGRDCGVSPQNPPDCIRTVDIFNSLGVYVGTRTINVCLLSVQVWSYQPGSVVLVRDYSGFSQKARDYAARVLQDLPNGLPGLVSLDIQILERLGVDLGDIIRSVLGIYAFDRDHNREKIQFNLDCSEFGFGERNNVSHPPLPNDSLFPSGSATFHHYDHVTEFCTAGTTGCTRTVLDNGALYPFSYPSYKMRATFPPLDGVSKQYVYAAGPFGLNDPEKYTFKFGPVTQTSYTLGTYPGLIIENRTHFEHPLYDGLITRTVTQKNVAGQTVFSIFTHGRGDAQYLSTITEGLNFPSDGLLPPAIHFVTGCLNDLWGPKIFRTLDRQAKKYWEENFSSTSQSSGQQSAQALQGDAPGDAVIGTQ